MFDVRMIHYVTIYDDGTVHVQNAVMGMPGQHHVHTLKGYKRWKKDVKVEKDCCEETKAKKGQKCDCGLKPGQTKDHEGHVSESKDHPEWK